MDRVDNRDLVADGLIGLEQITIMIRFLTLLLLLSVPAAAAETTNAPPASREETLQTDLVARARQTPLSLPEDKPNRIVGKKVAFSGISIFVFKTRNPLQLINPAAPARLGNAEENVVRDPATRQVSGLKIFCVEF